MICPFCGCEEKGSREHVFGQQFAQRFPSVARQIALWGDYAEPWAHDEVIETANGYGTIQVPRGDRTPELHEVKVKVGKDCNSGWMSQQDDAAVEVFLSLTADGGLRLPSLIEAQTISTWFIKTGLAYDLFLPLAEKAYSDVLRHEFFATRALPAGTTVYLGYEPADPEWVTFWQRGWHLASWGTPTEVIVQAPPNLLTTFIALLGLRLAAHRISPSLPRWQQLGAQAWLRTQMKKSQMMPITTVSTNPPAAAMDEAAVKRSMWAIREFVVRFSRSVAPDIDRKANRG